MGIRYAFTHRVFFRFDRIHDVPGATFRLLPLATSRNILSQAIDIKPAPSRLHRHTDAEGNPILRVDFAQEMPELQLTVDLLLDVAGVEDVDPFKDFDASRRAFRTIKKTDPLLGSAVIGEALPDLIAEWMDDISLPCVDPEFPRECAQLLRERMRLFLPLRPGIRNLAEIAADGKASASEIALLVLAMLRKCGLPCRFVSGYCFDTDNSRAELRAWIDIFHPEAGWLGLDPALNRWTGDSYVALSSCLHPEEALPFEKELLDSADFSEYYELKRLQGSAAEGGREIDRTLDQVTEDLERRLRRSGFRIQTASTFSFADGDVNRIATMIRDFFLPDGEVRQEERRMFVHSSGSSSDSIEEKGFGIFESEGRLEIATPFFLGLSDAAKKTAALFSLLEREGLAPMPGPHRLRIGSATREESPFLQKKDLLALWIGFWQSRPALSYLLRADRPGPTSASFLPGELHPLWIQELVILTARAKRAEAASLEALYGEFLPALNAGWVRLDRLFGAGDAGYIEQDLCAALTPVEAQLQRLLMLAVLVLLLNDESDGFQSSDDLYDRSLLPFFASQDLKDILETLSRLGITLNAGMFSSLIDRRYPMLGEMVFEEMTLSFREALEPCLHSANSGRLEVRVQALRENRYVLLCNSLRVPLISVEERGHAVAGVRYDRASALHFDIYDLWNRRVVSGCRLDSGRFSAGVHSVQLHGYSERIDLRYPTTLDLRRDV